MSYVSFMLAIFSVMLFISPNMAERTIEQPEGWYNPSDADFEREYSGVDLHKAIADFLGTNRTTITRNTTIGILTIRRVEGQWLEVPETSWQAEFLIRFWNPNKEIKNSDSEIGVSPSGELIRRQSADSNQAFKLGSRDAVDFIQALYPEIEYFVQRES